MADLNTQINEARRQGYSDADIIGYLGTSHPELAPKIKEATAAGYQAPEILGHLSGLAQQVVPGNTPAERRQYLLSHPDAAAANRSAIESEFGSFEHPAPEGGAAWRFAAGLVSPITGPAREVWQFVTDHDAWVRQHAGMGGAMGDVATIPGAAQAGQAASGDVAGAVGSGVGQAALLAAQLKAVGPKRLGTGAALPAEVLADRLEALRPRAPEPPPPAAPPPASPASSIPTLPKPSTLVKVGARLVPGGRTAVKLYEVARLGTDALRAALEKEQPEATAAPPVPEGPGAAVAREIGQDYAALSAEDRAALDAVARGRENAAAQPAPRPQPSPAPEPQPEAPPAPRGKTAAELLQEEMATRRAANQPPPAVAPAETAPVPATAQALALRQALEDLQRRKAEAATIPAETVKMTPEERAADFEQRRDVLLKPDLAEANYQVQQARIDAGMPPEETPPPAPAAPSGSAVLGEGQKAVPEGAAVLADLPEGMPGHYRDVQMREGTTRALQTFVKDQQVANYVLDKGITPDEWAAMPLDEQNRLVREAPTASGKGKHKAFVEYGEGEARTKGRGADEGIAHITETMRWIERQTDVPLGSPMTKQTAMRVAARRLAQGR